MTTFEEKETGFQVNHDGTLFRYVFITLSMNRQPSIEESYVCNMTFGVYDENDFLTNGLQSSLIRQHCVLTMLNNLGEFIMVCANDSLYAYTCLKNDLNKMAGET